MDLPAKLTPIEKYLVLDDYPAYPNTIGCRLCLTGAFNESLFDPVTRTVLKRHPMLRTVIEDAAGKFQWSKLLDSPHVEKLDSQFVRRPTLKKLDLRKEAGGQVHWANQGDDTVVNFLMHHAVADGVGGLQVVFDFMIDYDQQVRRLAGENPKQKTTSRIRLRKLDPSLLATRDNYQWSWWKKLTMFPRQLLGLIGVWEFLRNRPVALKPAELVDLDSKIPDGYPGLETICVGTVDQLQQRARSDEITTNDMLLRSVFAGVARFRKAHNFGSDSDLLRIMVPMNLRTIRDRNLPATNRTSFVSLDRKQSACIPKNPESLRKLQASIRFQMGAIQQHELGFTFLHMLNFYRWTPWGVKGLVNPGRVASTVLVTNLGEPFKRLPFPKDEQGRIQFGNLTLQRFELVAPLRPNTQAGFAVFRYAGKLMLSLTYDNRVISPAEAQSLTEMVSEEIRDHLGETAAL